MELQKQVHIYNLDTSCFYNDEEMAIHRRLGKMYLFRNSLRKRKNKNLESNYLDKVERYLTNVNRRINNLKSKLCDLFEKNTKTRELNPIFLNDRNVISIFASSLTRITGLKTDELTQDVLIVRVFYFRILEDLMKDGFYLNGDKYIYYTSSAGQIRTKKAVFIKESVFNKHKNTLLCGLTEDEINKSGGVNINKYLSYLALNNSATEVWKDFNIDKSIVVEDFKNNVYGLVDYINEKDYSITRKHMNVPIEHTDGCGMILPSKINKNRMIRLPWMKGLLSPFDFVSFIKEFGGGKVKDIYGKEWDLVKDGIEVIFTKSQFKMWRYYPNEIDKDKNIVKYGWDSYKESFKKYNCEASYCNEEEDYFKNSKICYQMLQTLTDVTDEELEKLAEKTNNNIRNIGYDRGTMLRVLGVTKHNKNKNYLQQAIEIYPEILNDTYSKQILKQLKSSLVKGARAGKLDIDAKYTYVIPDLFAFCENLILGIENPKGLLCDGEVYCRFYKDVEKLDCLRSPHLYREHGIRKNVIDEVKDKWFNTDGIYTSCHDLISKLLQHDNDGDTLLVVADKLFVEIAERNMKDIVPLYYEMANASNEQITSKSKYMGLINAFAGGNIGLVSNNITKVWNSEDVCLDVIKLLCLEGNFLIDYAKTLYKPARPSCLNDKINNYTKSKVPHFFRYAKDRTKKQVAKKNKSTVNRLKSIVKNPRLNFKAVGLNNFDYTMLMSNKDIDIGTEKAKSIIKKYEELDLKKFFIIERDKQGENGDRIGNLIFLYDKIRNKLFSMADDKNYVVDVLIKYLYKHKKTSFKTTIWECFGDTIVENLKYNIVIDITYCDVCGDIIERTVANKKYCRKCAREIDRAMAKKRMETIRNVRSRPKS